MGAVVVLCGFMGTGKSSVGAELAQLLDVPFVDTDAIIEKEAGATIAQIFSRHGETAFRRMEADVCRALDTTGGAVVATGGGMILDADNYERLSRLGTMVLLEADEDTLLARLTGSNTRPRLKDANHRNDVLRLLDERRPSYSRIEFRVDTGRRTPRQTAMEIAERVRHGNHIMHVRVDTRPLPGTEDDVQVSRVVVARGASTQLPRWFDLAGLRGPVCFVAPGIVQKHYRERLSAPVAAAGVSHQWIAVDDGDANKTLDQAEALFDALAGAGVGRDGIVVAAGGGVTGDLAGFVAASYMRGVALVHVPTTLLAQVDSSIGGKVGVNRPQAKNLVGTIYHPHLVVTDVELLATLPPRELAAGMAEVVKTAIIGAPELFAWLRERAADGRLVLDADTLDRCVQSCARVKAGVVERDPYERDRRRVLNLGHTFGHALETAAGYETIRHGEAVAVGLVTALRVAVSRGVASQVFLDDTEAVLSACGLDTVAPPVSRQDLRTAMGLDKKRRRGRLTFVLPVAPGRVEIVDDVDEDEILSAAATRSRPE